VAYADMLAILSWFKAELNGRNDPT